MGATATAAAAGRALASRKPGALISDRFAEPLVKAVGVAFYTRIATGELAPDDVDDGNDATFGVGRLRDMMTARTRYFDNFFSRACTAGVRQMVILASGLDCRAYRLTWPAGTTVFEIDQPQVLDFKIRVLAGLDARPTTEHRPVAVDLRRDWPSALQQNRFDVQQRTAWIAEGLLPFLTPDAQGRVLSAIDTLSAVGSRLATEEISRNLAQIGDRLAAVTNRWRDHGLDDPWTELCDVEERDDVAAYLKARGWQTTRTGATELLVSNGLSAGSGAEDPAEILNSLAYVSAIRRGRGCR